MHPLSTLLRRLLPLLLACCAAGTMGCDTSPSSEVPPGTLRAVIDDDEWRATDASIFQRTTLGVYFLRMRGERTNDPLSEVALAVTIFNVSRLDSLLERMDGRTWAFADTVADNEAASALYLIPASPRPYAPADTFRAFRGSLTVQRIDSRSAKGRFTFEAVPTTAPATDTIVVEHGRFNLSFGGDEFVPPDSGPDLPGS